MKKIFLLIILLGLCMALKPNSKKDEIVWSPDRKLTWKDFDKKLSKYAHEAALTYSGISYSQKKPINNTSIKVCVYAIFFKSLSGKSSEKIYLTKELLQHEQGHFDIEEWYARICRKKLQDTSFTSISEFNNAFLKIRTNNLKASFDEGDKYDKETNHSVDTTMQNKWNKYIAEQLNAYAAYSQSEFIITCGKK